MAKREPKSKKQIVQETKLKQDVKRQKAVIKDVLYPIFVKYGKTISMTERFADIFKVAITVNMQRPFKEKTIGDLDWSEELKEEQEGESKQLLTDLIEGFKDVSIPDTMKVLDLFEGGINGVFDLERRTRPFKEIELEKLLPPDDVIKKL